MYHEVTTGDDTTIIDKIKLTAQKDEEFGRRRKVYRKQQHQHVYNSEYNRCRDVTFSDVHKLLPWRDNEI